MFYIAVPSQNIDPSIIKECRGGSDYASLDVNNLVDRAMMVYSDMYEYDELGEYDIYIVQNVSLYNTIDDYPNTLDLFLHDHTPGYDIDYTSNLTNGEHYWLPTLVGYTTINSQEEEVLVFGNYQTVYDPYNHWENTGTWTWEIQVNADNIFAPLSLYLESGYVYDFTFTTQSEANWDGIIFSTTSLSEDGGNINGYGDARCSGNNTTTYRYTPSSNGYVYIYFRTDGGYRSPDPSYGQVSYTRTTAPTTRSITLDRTYGSGGDSSVTIPINGNYSSYPDISVPSCSGSTFRGYFGSNGVQYFTGSGEPYNTIPSDISTIYAIWTDEIISSLSSSVSVSYSSTGRYIYFGDVTSKFNDEVDIAIDDYGDYELSGLHISYDYPEVRLYFPGDEDGENCVPGTYSFRLVLESYGDSHSEPCTSYHYLTINVTKLDQSAPTAYGDTVWEGSTATATYSGGGGQGSIEWYNGSTRSSVGTTYTKCRWTGTTYYNPSPWSNEVALTVNADYVTDYDCSGYNYNYWASVNIGSGMSCSGGSATVTASAGHTHTYYYLYCSGCTSGPYYTYPSDSVTWSITTNGNNRFSKSGNTLNHDNMCTDTSTDTVVVTAVNSSSSSATSTDSKSIENPITNYDYNASNSYWASVNIGSGMSCSGGSATVTASAGHTHTYYYLYCSGCTSGPYYTYPSDSVTWSITTNGNNRFSKSGNTLNHDNMCTDTSTDTVVVTAVNSSSSSATATDTKSIENPITNYDYSGSNSSYWASISITNKSNLTCSGGSSPVSASAGHTHTYYYLYCSGCTSGPYYTYPSDSVTWSITTNGHSRFSKSGNTLNHSSMGKDSTTDTVVVTAVNSSNSNATSTDRKDIPNDYTDSWNNPSISTYYYDTIPAKGGTSSPHLGVSQSGTRTWCSGSTSTIYNYDFSKSYSMTSGNGFSISTTSGVITASNRGTTTGNARTSNTATVTVTGQGKSSTKTATCTQSANTLTLRLATGGFDYNHIISYNDITQLTVNAIYSSGANEDVTASASLSVGTSGIVSFGNNSNTLSIYIDDFVGDDWTRDERAQDWGYSGWDSYISDVIIDPFIFGGQKYVYTGQTFSYSGGTYYLWEQVADGNDNVVSDGKYLLTSTINYNTLYSYSMQNDHYNDYCPYVAILNEDFNAIYTPYANNDWNEWLIKVEHSN